MVVVAVVQAAMAAAEIGLYFLWSCCIVVAIVKKMETERAKAGIACDATARYSEYKVTVEILHVLGLCCICMTDRVIRSEPIGKRIHFTCVRPARVRRPHVGTRTA